MRSERANADIAQLLRRFENIIAYTPVRIVFTFIFVIVVFKLMLEEKQDRNAMAVGSYQMEVETAALVRAAEDILSLTRVLKESWLFGKLQTVGISEAENRAEEAAKYVAEGLSRLQSAGDEDAQNSSGKPVPANDNDD